MKIQTLINKYENLHNALEGLETVGLVNSFLNDLRKLKSENRIVHIAQNKFNKTQDI